MHTLAPHGRSLPLRVDTEAETVRAARSLAHVARRGDVIGLRGGLGSGKTAFARGFIRALTGPRREVPSPTFTLLQVYEGAGPAIYHFDLYRIETPEEVWELGFDEAVAEGIVLVEWPERLSRLYPADALDVTLDFAAGGDETARRIEFAGGRSWQRRLADLAAALDRCRDD